TVIACPLLVQTRPNSTSCDEGEGAHCSLLVNLTGFGSYSYDCTCASGLWSCSSDNYDQCPIGVLSDPSGTACVPANDSQCRLSITGAISTTTYECQCGASTSHWACSTL
ncbi:MAG TPA: hypothetical protein VIV60_25235, partial [Polyangiaceae bacterium]